MATDCPTDTKVCTLCRSEKPLGEFNRRARGVDGHASRCRACTRAYMAEWTERQRRRATGVASRPVVEADGRRECLTCGVVKSLELFHVDRLSLGGRSRHCAACAVQKQTRRRAERREALESRTLAAGIDTAVDSSVLKLLAACERFRAAEDDFQERDAARDAVVFRARQLLEAVGG